ncbi:MAG: HNH endonuclease signature motif containing protein [Candidatus Helarchaeota archaeon]
MPSVNTKKMPKKRKPLSTSTYRRFRYKHKKCQKCHKRFRDGNPRDKMEIHHVIPLSQGGTNTYSNLRALCGQCHYLEHSNEFTEEEFFSLRQEREESPKARVKSPWWRKVREEGDQISPPTFLRKADINSFRYFSGRRSILKNETHIKLEKRIREDRFGGVF